ncbi:MAG: hypothetical protein MSD82_04295 [Prevotella sp.]|nr:hypothetical protein [Prevotella sp.]
MNNAAVNTFFIHLLEVCKLIIRVSLRRLRGSRGEKHDHQQALYPPAAIPYMVANIEKYLDTHQVFQHNSYNSLDELQSNGTVHTSIDGHLPWSISTTVLLHPRAGIGHTIMKEYGIKISLV